MYHIFVRAHRVDSCSCLGQFGKIETALWWWTVQTPCKQTILCCMYIKIWWGIGFSYLHLILCFKLATPTLSYIMWATWLLKTIQFMSCIWRIMSFNASRDFLNEACNMFGATMALVMDSQQQGQDNNNSEVLIPPYQATPTCLGWWWLAFVPTLAEEQGLLVGGVSDPVAAPDFQPMQWSSIQQQ